MKNSLLTIATLTLLLAGQAAVAGDNSEEFLSWLNSGQTVTQVEQAPQLTKVSMMSKSIAVEADAFSLDYSSDK